MIRQDVVDTALALGTVCEAGGINVDHAVIKAAAGVSRSRNYRVHLPSSYSANRQYPLLMVLHGCRQDHLAIQSITGFDAIAEREEAIIVYPFVTSYAGMRSENCWGWWLASQRQRGSGEVADLMQIAENVSRDYSVDATQRHICGLSSGAAMAVAALATYSDYWASGASVAGVPYGESMRAVRTSRHVPVRRKTVNTVTRMLSRALVQEAPPLLIVQSSADVVVGLKLGENLRDSWRRVLNCDKPPNLVYSGTTRGIDWRLSQYGAQNTLGVAYLSLDNLGHGWAGGLAGDYSYPNAPNVSELIWAFCKQTAQSDLQLKQAEDSVVTCA